MRYLSSVIISLVIALSLSNEALGYRILGIFPHIGKSHSYAFIPLLKELAERGHDVTVISHFPIENPPQNYKDISLYGSHYFWEALRLNWFDYPYGTETIIKHVMGMYELSNAAVSTCKAMILNEEIQAMTEGQFDLAIIEQFNSDCGLGIVHKLKIPFIGITSHYIMPWTIGRVGIINNPSYVPNHFLSYGKQPSLMETVESVLTTAWYNFFYYLLVQIPERRFLLEHYDNTIPPLESIARNMSMVMIYTYFPLAGATPLPPNAIEIGGLHLQKIKKLDEGLETYLNNSKNGVILFTMGSMLFPSSWPKERLEAFQQAFEELSMYDVIWKWDKDTMENKPKNVKLVKWLPQYEILNHKNVKAFITHSGMLGLTEAVQSGVPVLTLPIYGDQFCNAAAARDSGIGEYISFADITKESLLKAIYKLLDPKAQERSDKFAEIWKDRPRTALDNAVFWVEHIAKYGSDHLRPTSVDLPFYRYYLLDALAVILIGSVILFYLNVLMCRFVCRRCFYKKQKND